MCFPSLTKAIRLTSQPSLFLGGLVVPLVRNFLLWLHLPQHL